MPLLTQLTGMSGQLGQLFSVVPFALILHSAGWTPAFLTLAAMSGLAVVLVLLLLQDLPPGHPAPATSQGLRATGISLAHAWRQPGTRLGLWSHFTVQFSGTVFAMTWGYPFLISAQGLDRGTVSALMALYVAAAIAAGPLMGRFVARHPLRRSTMVLLISGCTAVAWAAVLLLPGRAPLWLLAVLVVTLAVGGPGSMIGFDFARTFNPAHRLGTATGIVNVGGFIAALVSIYLIGLVLDLLHCQRVLPGRALRPGSLPDRPQRAVPAARRRGRGHHRHPAEGPAPDGGPGRHGSAAAQGPRRAAQAGRGAPPHALTAGSGRLSRYASTRSNPPHVLIQLT